MELSRGKTVYAIRRQKWREDPEARAKDIASMQRWAETNPLSYMLSTVRRRALVKGWEFTLTAAAFPTLPTHCPILGIELHYGRNRGGRQDNSASLDRRNCSLGYVPGNVHIVSWRANHVKGDATLEELKKLVAYLEA